MRNIINKVIKISLYLTVFLIPLFFLPFSFEAFEFNKQYLLFFLVSAALVCHLGKMIAIDKKISLKRTVFNIPVAVFLFLAILSAIFSKDRSSSLFGFYGRFSDGLLGLIFLAIFYFLLTNLNLKKESLLKAFFVSFGFVLAISLLSAFGVLSRLRFLPAIMSQPGFNPAAASMNGLAVFIAVGAVLLAVLLAGLKRKEKKPFAIYSLMLAAAFLLLIFIDFAAAWIVMLFPLVFLAAFLIYRRSLTKPFWPRIIFISALLLIAVLGIMFDSRMLMPSPAPQEQILSQRFSWQTAGTAAAGNVKQFLIGSGIGTFSYDFAKYKPVSFNKTELWRARFDRPGNTIAETLATLGFLGVLSYIFLAGLFLFAAYLILRKKQGFDFFDLALAVAMLAVLVSQFVYYQSFVLSFTFWFLLALGVLAWQNKTSDFVYDFKKSKNAPYLLNGVLGIAAIFILFFLLSLGRFYWADVLYGMSGRLSQAESAQRANLLERASYLNPYQAQYRNILARVYSETALEEARAPEPERDKVALTVYIERAIAFAKGGEIVLSSGGQSKKVKGAAELSPNSVSSWETLAMIYRDISGSAPGALLWGIKAYEKAIELEPTNPIFQTELGKLNLANNDTEAAKKAFEKAIVLKDDYQEALLLSARAAEREGDTEQAIAKTESLSKAYPFSTEVIFQLGRLYFNDGRMVEAQPYFEKLLVMEPNNSNALYALAVIYKSQGDTIKAKEYFERVLLLNPDNQDVRQKLKELAK
ncbi:MAG: tetratricopeptide repeat protein [Patescibacteria group bacterium]